MRQVSRPSRAEIFGKDKDAGALPRLGRPGGLGADPGAVDPPDARSDAFTDERNSDE